MLDKLTPTRSTAQHDKEALSKIVAAATNLALLGVGVYYIRKGAELLWGDNGWYLVFGLWLTFLAWYPGRSTK